jgi:HEAT repeat protein
LLADVREPDFKAPLIADLAQHPAENVRTAAARGLTQLRDDPEVRTALERALNDSSVEVQRTARAALDGVGPGFGL